MMRDSSCAKNLCVASALYVEWFLFLTHEHCVSPGCNAHTRGRPIVYVFILNSLGSGWNMSHNALGQTTNSVAEYKVLAY